MMEFLSFIFHCVVQASWVGSGVVVLAWVFTRLRPAMYPRFRAWIWRIVLLKFLISLLGLNPVSFPVNLSFAERWVDLPVGSKIASLANEPTSIANREGSTEGFSGAVSGSNLFEPTTLSDKKLTNKNANWNKIWICFYFIGVALVFTLMIAQSWSLNRLVRSGERCEVPPELVAQYKLICRKLKLHRPPHLVVVKGRKGPFLYGVFNSLICLPQNLLEEVSRRELKIILTHELSHFRRRHLWWNCFASALLGVFFFNPLIWLSVRELQFAQELEADHDAIHWLRESPQQYGEALLKVLRMQDVMSNVALIALGALGWGRFFGIAWAHSTLKRRFIGMQKIQLLSRRKSAFGFLVLMAVGVVSILPWRLAAQASSKNVSKNVSKDSHRSFSTACSDLRNCISAVSEITGDKYLYSNDVNGVIHATENMPLTQENATLLLTKLLHMNGYSRVPLATSGTYQIFRDRDARDTLLPRIVAGPQDEPSFPNTWDIYHFTYQAKHKDRVEEIARAIRSFMSPTSRVVPVTRTGMVLVTAPIPELKNVFQVMKQIDQTPEVPRRGNRN